MSALMVVAVVALLFAIVGARYSIRVYGPGGAPQFIDLAWVGLGMFAVGLVIGATA